MEARVTAQHPTMHRVVSHPECPQCEAEDYGCDPRSTVHVSCLISSWKESAKCHGSHSATERLTQGTESLSQVAQFISSLIVELRFEPRSYLNQGQIDSAIFTFMQHVPSLADAWVSWDPGE